MPQNKKENDLIPKTHPRYQSLKYRHKIIEGMEKLIVAEAGLIAHGRGECFDYILGERTNETAKKAIKAAIALLMLAKKPIISVNGNVAALVPEELVKFSKAINAPLEINLFYRKEGRIEAIKSVLEKAGVDNVLGTNKDEMVELEGLESNRRIVSKQGIKVGDVILVMLEDGDRTEALKRLSKKVIAVDLNPISRTAICADITIVDNIVRTLPEMIKTAREFKDYTEEQLIKIVDNFDNKRNICDTLDLIKDYIELQKTNVFKILRL